MSLDVTGSAVVQERGDHHGAADGDCGAAGRAVHTRHAATGHTCAPRAALQGNHSTRAAPSQLTSCWQQLRTCAEVGGLQAGARDHVRCRLQEVVQLTFPTRSLALPSGKCEGRSRWSTLVTVAIAQVEHMAGLLTDRDLL